MNVEVAIEKLKELKASSNTMRMVPAGSGAHLAWTSKIDALLVRSLGADSPTVAKFRSISYLPSIITDNRGRLRFTAQSRGVDQAGGLIDAAIFELELAAGDNPMDDGSAYDVGLWRHVRHSVAEKQWHAVASGAVIYVEDKVRRWSGDPRDPRGKKLVGAALFVRALGTDGSLTLGEQANEADGWRNLGSGLIAALGNVDRHNVQDRDDAQRYALGVLGLCSLLLTQIQFQHPQAAQQ